MLVDYARERFPLILFGPVGLGLAAVALIPSGVGAAGLAVGWAAALLLLFQLRLADDLVDRDIDRRRGLERVVVKSPSLHTFLATLAVLVPLTLLALALVRGLAAAATFVLLLLVLATGAQTPWLRRRPLVYALVPTLKYPAIVALLAPVGSAGLLVFVYAVAVGYELYHDSACRQALKGMT